MFSQREGKTVSTHPVRFPRFVFDGPGRVEITKADGTLRCRQAVMPPYSLTPRQCKKRGTTQEGVHWLCRNHKGLK